MNTLCLFLLVCSAFIIDAHNWLDTPVSRGDQRDTQTGCRYGGEGNPTCAGPCDRTVAQMTIPAVSIQRGQTISVKWNRHTHPGGFIRFAWSLTSQSDAHSSFDAHVDRFLCKEVGGCGPADPNSPAGDSNGLLCSTSIDVPLYLTNGAWTLQWAYFGGWYNAGDYYACVDYVVTGGPTGSENAAFYTGGDYTYPNQNVCLFYSTNALHVCTAEPCLNGTFPAGNQVGAPLGFSSNTGNTPVTTASTTAQSVVTTASTTAHAPVTTASTTAHAAAVTTASTTAHAAVVTTASTTGHAVAVTTASTTAHASPVTTASTTAHAAVTASTTAQAIVTTGTTTGQSPPNPTGSNCAGAITTISSSQATMTYVDSWGSGASAMYRAVIEIDVQESLLSNWRLQIVFPNNQVNPMLTSSDNAGSIQCQSNQSSFKHAVIKPSGWAAHVYSGSTLTVEIFGTNAAGLTSQQLIANTQLMVYTQ